MRRRGTLTALVGTFLAAGVACNGILGIDAPTLLVPSDAGDAGRPHDGTVPSDARKDAGDAATIDATSDARRDAPPDAEHDASAPDAATVDASDAKGASDATFDGNCTCASDACAPVVIAKLPSGVTSLTLSPTGLCFYAVNDKAPPFPGAVRCATFGGKTTTVDPDASTTGAVAAEGSELYWINVGLGEIRTCSVATPTTCTPSAFVDETGFQPQLALNATTVYSESFDGIHACPRAGTCTQPTTPLPGTNSSQTFAAISAGVFWASSSATTVLFCPTGGCADGGTVAATDTSEIEQVAATDLNLFWSNGEGALMMCFLTPATGTCAQAPTVLVPSVEVSQMVADSTHVYWTEQEDGLITEATLEGATKTVATAASTAVPIAVGPTCVFWADQIGDAGVLKAVAK